MSASKAEWTAKETNDVLEVPLSAGPQTQRLAMATALPSQDQNLSKTLQVHVSYKT